MKRKVLDIKTEAKQERIFMQTNGRQRYTTCIRKKLKKGTKRK